MIYGSFFIGFLAVLLAVTRWRGPGGRRKLLVPAAIAAITCIALVVAWQHWERKQGLQHVPAAWGVDTILFADGMTLGDGPGGAWNGVYVYALPDAAAKKLAAGGLAHLKNMSRQGVTEHGDATESYDGWRQGAGFLDLGDFICLYDSCLTLPKDLRIEINAVFDSPDSYLAKSRSGTIVVSPSRRRVVYLYRKCC
jgi:hypothetical protein